MNQVILIGRNCSEGELRYSQAGNAIYANKIAVDRGFKNQQGEKETDFIPYVAYKGLAENTSSYTGKGSLIAIKGSMRVSSYDGQDGQKKYKTEVIAQEIKFLTPKNSSNNSFDMGQPQDFTDDEIPFR